MAEYLQIANVKEQLCVVRLALETQAVQPDSTKRDAPTKALLRIPVDADYDLLHVATVDCAFIEIRVVDRRH